MFGGTWTKVTNRFLVGSGSGYSIKSTGGSDTHSHTTNAAYTDYWCGTTGSTTLTAAQSGLPNHYHRQTVGSSWQVTGGGPFNDGGSVYGEYPDDNGRTTANFQKTGYTGGWNASEGHTHSIPSHRHYISPIGTSSASNIPPYYAVYMWVRTA